MLDSIHNLFPTFPTWPTLPNAGTCVNGHPHAWEREELTKLVIWKRAKIIFEIGTFTGTTTNALARIPGVEKVYTLDIPTGTLPVLPLRATDRKFLYTAQRETFPGNVTQLWGDSARFDFRPHASECDFVFVMGAHSPEYIANDLSAAFIIARPDGMVVIHTGDDVAMRTVGPEYTVYQIGNRMGVVIQNDRSN